MVFTKLFAIILLSFEYRVALTTKMYYILSSIVHTFYMENDAEIFPAHYTLKVAEEGFKMASM